MTAKMSIILILMLSFSLTLFVYPAEAKSYGWLVKNNKIERKFKSGKIPRGYSYYFRGWKGEPEAIIGIKHGYTLKSKQWKFFNPKKISVRTLILRMYKRESTHFYGAWIIDHRGRKMGIWFSDSEGAKIKMAGKTKIAYISPMPVKRKRLKRRLFE